MRRTPFAPDGGQCGKVQMRAAVITRPGDGIVILSETKDLTPCVQQSLPGREGQRYWRYRMSRCLNLSEIMCGFASAHRYSTGPTYYSVPGVILPLPGHLRIFQVWN